MNPKTKQVLLTMYNLAMFPPIFLQQTNCMLLPTLNTGTTAVPKHLKKHIIIFYKEHKNCQNGKICFIERLIQVIH